MVSLELLKSRWEKFFVHTPKEILTLTRVIVGQRTKTQLHLFLLISCALISNIIIILFFAFPLCQIYHPLTWLLSTPPSTQYLSLSLSSALSSTHKLERMTQKSLLLVVVASPISLFAKRPLSYYPHKTYCPYGAFTHLMLTQCQCLRRGEERRGEVVVVVVVVGVQLKPILE